jgi:hypothetical protein
MYILKSEIPNNKDMPVEEKSPHKPMVTATPGATHSLPTDQKLDRIYDVLNHIRWIMIAFVMVTIGIPFILGAILG